MKPKKPTTALFFDLWMLLSERRDQIRPINALRAELLGLYRNYPGLFGGPYNVSTTNVGTPARSEPLTPEITSHPAFLWLKAQRAAAEGLTIVLENSPRGADKSDVEPQRIVRYWSAITSFYLSVYSDSKIAPKPFSTAARRELSKKASDLSKALSDGIGRFSGVNRWELGKSLDQLATDITKPHKRDYGSPERDNAYLLVGLATQLLPLGFKNLIPIIRILDLMSESIGFDRKERTLRRYIRDAAKLLK